tara:strand:+ start:1621 stop:2559 length:939 start_codon:yes stop_codon:yes gene_type:complete
MLTIKQPNKILLGYNSAHDFEIPDNSLIITSKGAKSRGWINYIRPNEKFELFDQVENNPSMNTVNLILEKFNNLKFSAIIGLGGGSCLDVAKFVAYKMNTKKILIPTTFGSGSEVTRISVLKIDGKKQSFHDDKLFSDIAIVDSYFLKNTPESIRNFSAIDALAQCSEAYDSSNSNLHTKFLCMKAFEVIEQAIYENDDEKLALGSLIDGLGFGNASTTLGHALSYVYSNEGFSHGHALAYTTLTAHNFNNSIFYERFKKIIHFLDIEKISLNENFDEASEIILNDRKHLDNNPKPVTKENIIELLKSIENL